MTRKTQNEKTLRDVMRYIADNAKDGYLKESMIKIGSKIGYANATIHRALLTLEDRGHVEVIPAPRSGEAHTIRYISGMPDRTDDMLERAHTAMTNLASAVEGVQSIMREFRDMYDFIEMDADQSYAELH